MGSYIPSYYVPFVRQGHWRWVILPDGHGTRLSDALFDPMGLGLFWIDSGIKEQTLAAMKAGQKFEPVTIVDETWKVEN
jgi:microcin C transport system substrate-binding protein